MYPTPNIPTGKTPAPQRRTVCYCRVSSQEQAEEGYSLPDQQRACRLYAQMKVATGVPGWTEIADADIFTDPGVSGTLSERPALARLLAEARAGHISHLVCTKMDRLARSLKLLLTLWDELEGYGVSVTVIEFGLDTSTPVGRLIRNVLGAIGEFERDTIIGRTSAGLREAVRQGAVIRPGTLGYLYVKGDKKKGQLPRVEIDPDGAPLVLRIFTAVASGTSLQVLARTLNADGVPTPRGASMWRIGTLRAIILNPIYTGQAAYGRRRNVKTAPERRRPERCRKENGGGTTTVAGEVVHYTDVPAIVTPELAQAAGAALARNRAMATRNAKADYLLGGRLLRCTAPLEDGTPCGSIMHGEQLGKDRVPHYRCSHQEPSGRKRHSIPGHLIEGAVWEALCATLTDSDTVLDGIKALSDESSAQTAQLEGELRMAERASAEIDRQRDALLDLHLAGRLDAERFSAKDAVLQERQQALLDQHAALAARRNAALAQQLPFAEVEDLCRRLAGKLDDLSFAQRRRLVRTLFTSGTTDRKSVHLEGVFDVLSMTLALNGHAQDGQDSGIVTNTPERVEAQRLHGPDGADEGGPRGALRLELHAEAQRARG